MSLETTIDVIWRRFWTAKIAILATIFSSAEALVSAGLDLPGSKLLPVWSRGLVYMAIMGAAAWLRWLEKKNEKDQGNG